VLKRNITYEDGDGKTVTETFYFNLTARELSKFLGGDESENLDDAIKKMQGLEFSELVKKFDELILSAYGIRSEDNKRFIKSDELKEKFSDSFAYDALFMELAINDNAASEFFMGVIPKELKADFAKAQETVREIQPPTPPMPSS
jgi:hypothetical protein